MATPSTRKPDSLLLLCLGRRVFKPLRWQAVVTLPVVQPGLLVASEPASRGALTVPRTVTPQRSTQPLADQHRQLRHGQRRRPPFFPAWFPASGTRSPAGPGFGDGASLPRYGPGSPPTLLPPWRAGGTPRCGARP